MQKFIIGIDTGGTFTDAVLMDCESGEVVASTKAPTTHFDLSLGIGKSLKTLLSDTISPEQVRTVAVSSTLATNAVVENKGARVAVITIGYVRHFKLPVTAVIYVKGGHDIHGNEEEPLDLDYLVQIISGLKKDVDAYGVCGAMSMKNPAHELVAEKAISMIDPKPVFCSHRISQQAGMEERAATAALHAKLMPVMEDFVKGVRKAMQQSHLDCPLVIVGGNGQSLTAETAVTEAGQTVASGPACTAFFGGSFGTASDCLVLDVGGTTTDIAMIRGGAPLMTEDGCHIGDWKTRVEAVNMKTEGIGGDSHVHLDDRGKLRVGPVRVTPLCLAATPPVTEWLGSGGKSRLISMVDDTGSDGESELARLLCRQKQLTPAMIREAIGLGGVPLENRLAELERKQQIQSAGFTPTDALHVLGSADFGDREKALEASKILGGIMGLDPTSFAQKVLDEVERKIENLIIDYVVQLHWGKSLTGFLNQRNTNPILGVSFTLRLPIVGVGAAAPYFLPRVAKRLATTVQFPDHSDVGNGVGAARIALNALIREQ